MINSIFELKLSRKQRKYCKILREKFPVSFKFLSQNIVNIRKYLLYSISLHCTIYRKYAIRNKNNRVIIHYRKLRSLVFDPKNLKWIRRRQKNVRQWSKRVVMYLKSIGRITQHEEMEIYDASKSRKLPSEEVSKQLKEQLELLKSGKRVTSLMDSTEKSVGAPKNNQLAGSSSQIGSSVAEDGQAPMLADCCEITPEKQKLNSNSKVEAAAPAKLYKQNHTENSMDALPSSNAANGNAQNVQPNGGNFLDMLMNKVRVKTFANVKNFDSQQQQQQEKQQQQQPLATMPRRNDELKDIYSNEEEEEFLGFDDCTYRPGMMLTPVVPKSTKTSAGNSVFVSESLDEYMRENNLCESNEEPACSVKRNTVDQASLEGLVTPNSEPPHMDMPAVPESLQKLRTVAKRREYLQKFPKTHKMVLINNEANIYRELQRKVRQQKVKATSMLLLQSPSTQMPFTRDGWQAASYVATDYNKYYYQTIKVDGEIIKLPGTMGNNDQREKKPYLSIVQNVNTNCGSDCVDAMVWRDFKIIKSKVGKTKLNKFPLPPDFRPCPLSHKAIQKPLDDDAAALLLAGGSMAIVSMPTVELEVFPETGKPLNEIAKRYLQYILPHHNISREWAKFSVSTLREINTSSTSNSERNSFTFSIPYINDRNQILVRRVIDRSEKLDETFELEQMQDTPLNCFTFRENVNPEDSLAMDCADVLSDMINCVGISCSENSFIKDDFDDFRYEHNLMEDETLNKMLAKHQNSEILVQEVKRSDNKTPAGGKQNPAYRQQRLRLELKRLNATIIETATKNDKDSKPCTMSHCQLGCVCDSIAGELPVREHCGKAGCVVKCSCKNANLSRIVRLETDGCGISNEDAFRLRLKATARLAPMEKEFTSTVVLTENETLLINESQRDKKRRCTKAPKRYEDFADTDDDFLRVSPKRSHATQNVSNGSVMAIDTLDPCTSNSSSAPKIMDLREPCSIREQDFEKLKHCTISLRRLPDMSNVVQLCMTHQLYKCFCEGQALEGNPIVLEKEVENPTNYPKKSYAVLPPAKASYSFDKVERSVDNRNQNHNQQSSSSIKDNNAAKPKDSSILSSSLTSTNVPNNLQVEGSKMMTKNKETSIELEVIQKYKNLNQNICRRAIAIPSKCFKALNNRRRQKVLLDISTKENHDTHVTLLRHMHEAAVHYRKEMETERIKNCIEESKMRKRITDKGVASVIELQDDDDDDKDNKDGNPTSAPSNSHHRPSLPTTTLSSSSSTVGAAPSSSSIVQKISVIKRKVATNVENLSKHMHPAKIPKLIINSNQSGRSLLKSENQNSNNNNSSNSSNNDSKIQVPRIAACYSLSSASTDNIPSSPSSCPSSPSVNQSIIPPSTVSSGLNSDTSSSPVVQIRCAENPSESNQHNYKDFYQDVVKNMNSLVSKKMQDIDMALQRDSKLIPAPNEEILCIIKWTNFLDAFECGCVFIWDVKMRSYNFLAATITNMMPIVCGAIGVVNIVGLRPSNLPFLAQNLLQHKRTSFTERLAIVMQGRKHYWIVKGHLLHTSDNACTRPTPQTHPLLTKKINLLCSQLVKQRIREKHRKQTMAIPVSSSSIITVQDSPPRLVGPASEESPIRSQPARLEFQQNTSLMQSVSSRRSTTESHMSQRESSEEQPQKRSQPQVQAHSQPQVQAHSQPQLQSQLHHQPQLQSQPQPLQSKPQQPQPSQSQDQSSLRIKSNIEFRCISQSDIENLMLPERHNGDHRWLVLELHNDFSHIFVPAFKDMISLDRIHNVMNVAHDKNKIVKLQFFNNAPYDAFVTPTSKCQIYFGPLKLNMTPPLLVLLQSVDGKMMLREVYQRQHGIYINPENRTTAFWVLYVNGEISFEIGVGRKDGENGKLIKNSSSLSLLKPQPKPLSGSDNQTDAQQTSQGDNSDDDCVIVDDNQSSSSLPRHTMKTSPQTTELQTRLNFSIQQTVKDNSQVIQISPAATKPVALTDPSSVSLPSNIMVKLPTTNSTGVIGATATSEIGFIPLVNSIPGNAIISVAPTSSSYIISPMLSTTVIKKPTAGTKRLAKVLPITQQTYLTPDVQMTSTTDPESFTETPPVKMSRISLNSNVARINNNIKGIKQQQQEQILSPPQTQTSVSKESSIMEVKKTTVGCTTITRLNEGNKASQTIAVKEVLNVNKSLPTAGQINGNGNLVLQTALSGNKSKQPLLMPSSSSSSQSLTLTPNPLTTSTTSVNPSAKGKRIGSPLTASEVGVAKVTTMKSTLVVNSNKTLPKSDGSVKQNQNNSIQIEQQNNQPSSTMSSSTSTVVNINAFKAKRSMPLAVGGNKPSNDSRAHQQQQQAQPMGGRHSAPIKVNKATNPNILMSKFKLPHISSSGKVTNVKYKHQHQLQNTKVNKNNKVEYDDHRYDHDDDDDSDNDGGAGAGGGPGASADASSGDSKNGNTNKEENNATKVTTNNKPQTKKSVVSFEYGYIWAPQMPKFVVRIVENEYLIKVPKVGILRMKGMNDVVNYLNSHCSDKSKVPANWKYYLQKRVTQTVEKEVIKSQDSTTVGAATVTSSSSTGELNKTPTNDGGDGEVNHDSSKKNKTAENESSVNSMQIGD